MRVPAVAADLVGGVPLPAARLPVASARARRALGTALLALLLVLLTTAEGRYLEPVTAPCPVSPLLVPSCGVWLGVAPGSFTDEPKPRALAAFEAATGAPTDVVHVYHRAGELFPTAEDRAMTRQDGAHRLLMVNYKPEGGHTWAQVAAGAMDGELDREAAYLRAHYRDRFFFAVHHEPEDEVRATPGSGFTAADYAAMYRHVVTRLRDRGVDNLVTVLNYMGYPVWPAKPWFGDLYPGDDVVDWIAWDPYACQDGKGCGSFGDLLDRTFSQRWPGFYTWATTEHPGTPLMLAEWGAEDPKRAAAKADFFRSVAAELPGRPALKALIYFGSPTTRVDSSRRSAAAFRALVGDPAFAQRVP